MAARRGPERVASGSRKRVPGPLRLSVRRRQTGDERGSALLQRGQLGPQPLQLTVDPHQLGARLHLPEVLVAVSGLDEFLDLAAQEPEPWVPVRRVEAVVELAGVDRIDDLDCARR